jgi:hypothetical protein
MNYATEVDTETEPRPYSELSEEAKAAARDEWRERGWTWDEWNSNDLTVFMQEELTEEYGIDEAEISWSLGYCQSDGVSFDACLNLDKMAAKIDTVAEMMRQVEILEAVWGWEYPPEWTASMLEGRVEVELYPMDYVDASHDARQILGEIADDMAAELDQVYKQACRRLQKLGYAEIEDHDSDEYIHDELTANDQYFFTEEGEFVQ